MTFPATRFGNPDSQCRTACGGQAPPFLIRLESIPATPENVERIRKRVEEINNRLCESNTPFRLRVA